MRIRVVLVLLGLVLVGACSSGKADPVPTPSPFGYPGTEEGAAALARDLRTATTPELFQSLKPTSGDYRTLYDDEFAARAEPYYERWIWTAKVPAPLEAKPDQTETSVQCFRTDDIRAWTPEVRANLAGGYEKVAPHIRPGLILCDWEYTRPGESYGMAYNGLAYVNQRWVFTPKPWRVLG
ncbi:hypothetical protein [Micromonospora thermarum]|uniref:Lipoprotein n=1 Tax=Micromonospora thermarum TaxID=2720024 RepID=A0ABX0ZJ49_9ACTN|nr:hypothetical protein [Micromonospora thermarum]NJP35850.1 hypothetical protein [Micromonospora thermarum]